MKEKLIEVIKGLAQTLTDCANELNAIVYQIERTDNTEVIQEYAQEAGSAIRNYIGNMRIELLIKYACKVKSSSSEQSKS